MPLKTGNISPQHPRADTGRIYLKPRDEEIMKIIAEQGGMRYDQVGMWLSFFPEWQSIQEGHPRELIRGEDGRERPRGLTPLTTNAVRRVVRRWLRKGYATYDRLQANKPFWIWMLDSYMEEYGLPYAGTRPSKKMLQHLYQINEVRIILARSTQFPRHTWLSERSIIAEREEAMPEVTFAHPPDGALLLENGKKIAIEIERSIKDYQTLEEIHLDLLENYIQVFYFCTQQVEPVLLNARSKLNDDQQERIVIYAVLND